MTNWFANLKHDIGSAFMRFGQRLRDNEHEGSRELVVDNKSRNDDRDNYLLPMERDPFRLSVFGEPLGLGNLFHLNEFPEIQRNDNEIRFSFNIPDGFQGEDLNLKAEPHRLVVSASVNSGANGNQSHQSFHQSISLDEGLEYAEAKANYKKGKLEITIPRKSSNVKHIKVR
jgi:hypothetical protein